MTQGSGPDAEEHSNNETTGDEPTSDPEDGDAQVLRDADAEPDEPTTEGLSDSDRDDKEEERRVVVITCPFTRDTECNYLQLRLHIIQVPLAELARFHKQMCTSY